MPTPTTIAIIPPKKYRMAKDLVVPKGNVVVRVSRMRKEISNIAMAVISLGDDMHAEWHMFFDDALRAGLIEEVSEPANL